MEVDKYKCVKQSTGEEVTLSLEYGEVLNAGILRIIRRDNESYKIIEREGSRFGTRRSKSRGSSGVTKRNSVASGVHRDQVAEAREVAGQLHSGIEVKNNGEVSFSDRRARRAWLKHCNLHDRDGGYSD